MTDHQDIFYHFSPAVLISNFVPLVVIFSDKEKAKETHFEYKMWNVLTVVADDFSYENKDLVQTLINNVAEEYECEEHIYLYGNNMGGHWAILYAVLCNANAVYANTPYIKSASKENDLSTLLNNKDSFPIFYLCHNSTIIENNELVYFVDACNKYEIKVNLNFCPDLESDTKQHIQKVLDMFERMV